MVLFRAPQRGLQLAALCVLQEYERLKSKDAAWSGDFYITGVDEDLKRFFVSSLDSHKVRWLINEEPTVKTSFYFEFDEARAYRLSESQRFNVVRAFGIMLGCEPPSYFPDLRTDTAVLTTETPLDFLVLPGLSEDFAERVLDIAHIVTVFHGYEGYRGMEEILSCISQSKIVVGPTGVETYIAASLGKTVIELYPDSLIHTGWLSKFMTNRYYLVKETALRARPRLLTETAEVVWARIS